MAENLKAIAITGPTATGKTALAVQLARQFQGEIISIDSRQVYRGMDLGTGKDLAEYGEIPYHLIDVADPRTEVYHLGRFLREAFAAALDIAQRGKLPIFCGGTALYLEALIKGFRLPGGALPPRKPGEARQRNTQDGPDSFIPPATLEPLVLGVFYPRSEVRHRIEVRLDARFEAGMVHEIEQLLASGVTPQQLEFFGLEYREIVRYVQKLCTFEEMRQNLLNKIRQFAKRQDIFFRKMERSGIPIYWCQQGKNPDPAELITAFLAGEKLPAPQFRLSDIDYGKISEKTAWMSRNASK